MATMTKAQVLAENAGLRHNNELLRTQLEEAQAKLAVFERPPTRVVHHKPRPMVYEFNPAIPGDFDRASKLARATNGIVKRAIVQ